MRVSAGLLALLLAGCASRAPERPMVERCFQLAPDVEQAVGYCQAVRDGDWLHISGTVGQGPMPDAIRMAYAALSRTLAAHGLDAEDIVSERVYTTDIDAFIQHQGIRKRWYGDTFPASSWVQVERLYLEDFVVEVEALARLK